VARVLSIRLKEPQGGDHHFAHVDYRSRFALVAEEQKAGGPLLHAVARYEPGEANGTTEIAILVEDGWQHRGLGALLLDALLAAAEAGGLRYPRACPARSDSTLASFIRRASMSGPMPNSRRAGSSGRSTTPSPMSPMPT
jgi:GNAT superfamily N-acetyltransferase